MLMLSISRPNSSVLEQKQRPGVVALSTVTSNMWKDKSLRVFDSLANYYSVIFKLNLFKQANVIENYLTLECFDKLQ